MKRESATIGDYRVIRLLGKGGMSEVYEVENPRLGSRHALKLFAYGNDDPEVLERFKTEGRLLAKLDHPRIVKVTDLGSNPDDGRPYFVMELVTDGGGNVQSLADVAPGDADEETIGRWYDDLREGLDYIHRNGVIHRDLKLQNVLIGPDGHAVLTDFGISRIFGTADGKPIVDTVQTIVKMREGRNLVMGSIGYMAPELEMGVAASRESDWYALGVIVYKLLTGTWCDSRTDVGSTLDSYDPAWRRIVPKLLHSNPQGRECLSYAEETRSARERQEAQFEDDLLAAKRRGKLARHWARAFAGLAAVLAIGVVAVALKARHDLLRSASERDRLAVRLAAVGSGGALKVPEFDELFRIPSDAKSEESTDAAGRIIYSRAQYEAAKLDALVLTHSVFAAMREGKLSLETAAARLDAIVDQLSDDSFVSPFDAIPVGDDVYNQVGETEPLRQLLGQAAQRMRELAAL